MEKRGALMTTDDIKNNTPAWQRACAAMAERCKTHEGYMEVLTEMRDEIEAAAMEDPSAPLSLSRAMTLFNLAVDHERFIYDSNQKNIQRNTRLDGHDARLDAL